MRVVDIIGDGEFDLDVRGESNYQTELEKIVGPRTEESKRFSCDAILIREPNNPFDVNAVRVVIHGMTVGYLPREDAEEIAEFLLEECGVEAVGRCKAIIVGGWARRSGDGSFGVKLDVECPPKQAIETQPFTAPRVVEPRSAPRDLTVWSRTVTAAATAALAMLAVFLWKSSRPPTPTPSPAVPVGIAQPLTPAPVVATEPASAPPAQATPIAPAESMPAPRPANIPLPPPRPRDLK